MRYFFWFFVFATFMIFSDLYVMETDQLDRYDFYTKMVADIASHDASQFLDKNEKSYGNIVFLQDEGNQAAVYAIRENFDLDGSLNFVGGNMFVGQVEYEVIYFDDSNTVFPVLYEDTDKSYIRTITAPTVIVKINLGVPRFRGFDNSDPLIRISSFTYSER